MENKLYLCGKKGCCPAVEVTDESVKIGEEGNLCILNKEQRNDLVSKIRSGKLA